MRGIYNPEYQSLILFCKTYPLPPPSPFKSVPSSNSGQKINNSVRHVLKFLSIEVHTWLIKVIYEYLNQLIKYRYITKNLHSLDSEYFTNEK